MAKKPFKEQDLSRLARLLRPHRPLLIFILLIALAGVGLSMLSPVFIGRAVDYVAGPDAVDFASLGEVLLIYAATLLVSAACQWLMGMLTSTVVQRTTRDLRIHALSKINTLPIGVIDTMSKGDIVNRVVGDITAIGDGLIQGLSQFITGMITILGTIAFMLTVSVGITAIVVVMTPLSIFVASFIVKNTTKYYRIQSDITGKLSGHLNEMAANQKLITAFGYADTAKEKFAALNRELQINGVKAQFYSSMTNPGTRFVNALVYATVGVVGSLAAAGGSMSIGQVSAFLSYANQYTKPFNEISGVAGQIQNAFSSAERVFALLDLKDEEDLPGAYDKTDCQGRVTIKDAAFSYYPEQDLIEHFNLEAAPGSKIAIVGPTGCGKTTLVNLIMRFYDLKAGDILLDGESTTRIRKNSLRRLFGMVLQDTWLSTGTIRDNIAYARPEATLDEVVEAAKSARAHSFIMRLPKGYDTVVSGSGGTLSEGQRQLISIARIMLLDPPMLILDEATSNIDTRTELYIQRAFDKMMQGRTSFIIAHRLSTIEKADEIIVMDKGKIVEQGTHGALLEKGGLYKTIYMSQFAGGSH